MSGLYHNVSSQSIRNTWETHEALAKKLEGNATLTATGVIVSEIAG
jgi:hypothetical protein